MRSCQAFAPWVRGAFPFRWALPKPPRMTQQITMTGRAWGLMAMLGLLWGGSFPATAIVPDEMSFWSTVAIRVTLACLILWAAVLALGYPLPRRLRDWATILTLGVIGNALPFSLITWGQTTVPAGLAAILNASTALFTVLLAAVAFADERMTARKGWAWRWDLRGSSSPWAGRP